MRPGALIELDFITESSTKIHYHENFELLFVISGSVNVTIEDDSFLMKSGDIIIVNTNHRHGYEGTEDLVLGRFVISYSRVRELLGMNHVLFWCNSVNEPSEAYDSLRRIIAKIFNQSLNNQEHNKLYIGSLYYQMLYVLAENFTVSSNQPNEEGAREKTDDRMQEIFSYIRNNYQQNISLEDIAQHLFLSTTYVSKYIKQKCGINFISLLNSVRLSHAVEDLLYSDESIMKISLANGFASVAAFNKIFKENYHETPSEFRKGHKSTTDRYKENYLKSKAVIREKVEKYLERNPSQKQDELEEYKICADIDMNTRKEVEWDKCVCWMINIGTAVDLLNANTRQQILNNREQMGFKYVRFWDIYDPEMYLDIHSPDGQQNFSRLDAVTDFLVENQLRPYIELGFKSRRVIGNMKKIIHLEQRSDFFASEQEMEVFYHSLFGHFIKRYGSWEISQWYFEYWEMPETPVSGDMALRYAELNATQHKTFFRQFNIIAGALREQLPKAQIGGAGFPIRIYGETHFTEILQMWERERQQPDFISLSCYPYMQEMKNGTYYEKRLSDLNFVRYGIEMANSAMQKTSFCSIPIHVTEYSMSLSSRNVLNDSCLKAAYLVHNTIDCLGKAELLGHFFFTDAFAEERDTNSILFGGNGFLTKDGSHKPSYYAIEFLNLLYPTVIGKHENYLITKNERESIRLVCHNMKKPGYNYYLIEEDELKIKEIAGILSDREFLKISVKINNLKEGKYVAKTHILNNHHGSIQNKWISMNMESELTRKELNYLRMSSVSDISIQEIECAGGNLEFHMELEPNEIRYVHIYRK